MATERMYALAFQYKKTKLWQRMYDTEIFAVKLSDGEIGYCSVMGRMGEVNAVAVYVGETGFQSFRTLLYAPQGVFPNSISNYSELLLSQDCTQCVFDNKDALSPRELEEVRAYARTHGIKLGGANAFPQFVRYRPYRHPWDVTSELDRQRICEALEASVALSEMLKTTPQKELGLCPMSEEPGAIPMLEKCGDGFRLTKTSQPPEVPISFAAPRLSNDLTAARIKRMRKLGTLQCAVVRMPAPIQENKDEAPYYAVVLLAVDEDTEMVLPPTPVTFFEERPERLLDTFAQTLIQNEYCPKKIRVEDERTFALLENFCAAAGIKLAFAKESELASLNDARDSFLYAMLPNDECMGEDEDDDDTLDRICDMIMMLGDDELRQLPKGLVKQLLAFADEGLVSPEVEARLRRLIGR